jgi:predicted metalloprotease
MRWQDLRRSENVEDRRGVSGRTLAVGGGGLGMLILIIIIALMGGDPSKLVSQMPQGGAGQQTQAPDQTHFSPEEQQLADFVSAVLASTEDVWTPLFQQGGRQYRKPKLVLFTGQVQSACGMGSAGMGPFYCPEDEKIYIDLAFYRELKNRFRAPGDFAQAYVIAHEVGHHVQKLLGTSDQVHRARSQMSESEYNALSVRLELQADYFAGVWAHHAEKYRSILEQGDIEEALNAATAIGDDNIQKQAQGYVVPDSFTHGSGEQRVRWFTRGFRSGDPAQGDTFNARDL